MKDRIRKIMDSQGMSQQAFASFIDMSPATLSSIFNGRTKPTLNMVEAVKKKFPDISTDWLMFGKGDMYLSTSSEGQNTSASVHNDYRVADNLDMDANESTDRKPTDYDSECRHVAGFGTVANESCQTVMKISDRPQRRIIEIKVYYDDHTYESFVPSGKN